MKVDLHLIVGVMEFGSMVELAVVPWAATTLAPSATRAIVALATMLRMVGRARVRMDGLIDLDPIDAAVCGSSTLG